MMFIPLFGMIAVAFCSGNSHTFEGHRVTHKVWFEMKMNNIEMGRIEIGLFGKIMPVTVKNFVTLARKPAGQGYKGSKFHYINDEFIVGGDWLAGDGKHGASSFDNPDFTIENVRIKHYGAGWVSMDVFFPFVNSIFFITFKKVSRLDGICPVFGKVIKGMSVVRDMSRVAYVKNKPKIDIIISDCGAEMVDPPFYVSKTDATN